MLQHTSADRYSSVVTLRLLVGGTAYPLSQIGPDFVVLKSPTHLPPGPATIHMVVDGEERTWDITLGDTTGPAEIIPTTTAA